MSILLWVALGAGGYVLMLGLLYLAARWYMWQLRRQMLRLLEEYRQQQAIYHPARQRAKAWLS